MFCHRPLALSSSVSSVTVLLVSPSLSSVIVPLFCHRPSPLSPSPSSVTVPLLCHRPSPLSPSVTVPLLCHRPSPLSPSVTVPLLCHRPSPLSPSSFCHRPPALSSSLSSFIVPLLYHLPLLCHRAPVLLSSPRFNKGCYPAQQPASFPCGSHIVFPRHSTSAEPLPATGIRGLHSATMEGSNKTVKHL